MNLGIHFGKSCENFEKKGICISDAYLHLFTVMYTGSTLPEIIFVYNMALILEIILEKKVLKCL